jgi:hypothetical protein
MNFTLAVVWGCLFVGVLLAALFGRASSNRGAKIATSIGLGVLLFLVVNAALAACVKAKLCPALGDTGIIYTLYPFLAIPVFYLVARISRSHRTTQC